MVLACKLRVLLERGEACQPLLHQDDLAAVASGCLRYSWVEAARGVRDPLKAR